MPPELVTLGHCLSAERFCKHFGIFLGTEIPPSSARWGAGDGKKHRSIAMAGVNR